MRRIIGLQGFMGSGKDTTADYLVTRYKFKRLTFATKLKDAVSAIFDLPRDKLEGTTREDRDWRETKLDFWSNELGKTVTPRSLLQNIGTEAIRNGFNDNTWVLLVKKELLENPETNFVISDVRLFNEAEMIKELNGEIWNIKRNMPRWWNLAIEVNKKKLDIPEVLKEVHYTEWALAGYNFDREINNEGDIDTLYFQIDNIMKGNK